MIAPDRLEVSLGVEGVSRALVVDSVHGEEALSELFELRIGVRDPDGSLDLDELVGRAAHLQIRAGDDTRHVHGILADLEQAEAVGEHTRYTARLVPLAWLLDQGRDSRVFQGSDVAAILGEVLGRLGQRSVRFALARTYAPRELCVQYRESDWAFACRLMEEEGIFHVFEHDENGHVLVVADTPSHHPSLDPEPIAFVPSGGTMTAGEAVQSFAYARRIRPGKVTGRSSSFWNPGYTEEASAARDRTELERYEPGVLRPDDRLDALHVARAEGRGEATSIRLVPGHRVTLTGHPRASFNARWLLTRVEHRLDRDAKGTPRYAARFTCIPDDATFRPDLRTPRPRIIGPQTATVVGRDGDEIHVDAMGRVLLHMQWDRSPADAAHACWVPVAQMASGVGFGTLTVPRVGSSVVVEFVDGDPDRPLVTGRVYNQTSPFPYPLPEHATRSTWQTRSSPGGEGWNELRFEDAAGREEVYLRAQRDLAVEALHDATCTVGGDATTTVTGSRTATVGVVDTTTVGGARVVSVGAADATTVIGDQTVQVGGSQTVAVAGGRSVTVGAGAVEAVTADREVRVGGADTRFVGGASTVTVTGDRTVSVGGDEVTTITGTRVLQVGGAVQSTIDGNVAAALAALQLVVEGDTQVQSVGQVKIESDEATKIGAPAVYVSGTTLYLRAYTRIVLEVGSSEEGATRSQIEITNGGVYVSNGEAKKELLGGTIFLNC